MYKFKVPSSGIFNSEMQAQLFAKEESHFWFKTRAKFILNRLKKLNLLKANYRVAEVGCGNGYTSSKLINHYKHYSAIEGTQTALDQMQMRLDQANIDRNKYKLEPKDICKDNLGGGYDIVFAFDVLEHINPSSTKAHASSLDLTLKNIYQSLDDQGKLVITVPAMMWLWTNIDDDSGHYQRFSANSMRKLLEANGFKVEYQSYMFLMVLPFYVLQRLILFSRKKSVGKYLEISPLLNSLMSALCNIDFILLPLMGQLIIGSSLFCIASKSPSKYG